ncbi:hypothetical protein A2U01_0057328, partial [Trifolium medium]|nr:hypothetical protein [Trifolium medium]
MADENPSPQPPINVTPLRLHPPPSNDSSSSTNLITFQLKILRCKLSLIPLLLLLSRILSIVLGSSKINGCYHGFNPRSLALRRFFSFS